MTEDIKSNNDKNNESRKFKKILKNSFFFLFFIIPISITTYLIIRNIDNLLVPKTSYVPPDYISILPVFSGGIFIALWYIYRGKSVKSLNDVILFASASYALYLFLFDYEYYKNSTELQYIADHIIQLSLKVLLLISTVGKSLITAIEFSNDRYKEDFIKKQQKLYSKQKNEIPSPYTENNSQSRTATTDLITFNNCHFKKMLFLAILMMTIPLVVIYLHHHI